MNLQIFILLFLVLEKSFGFKPNHQIDRLSKSAFKKKCKESFTPARYKVGLKCINLDQTGGSQILPVQYFPDVEYPTNIMEASRPFYCNTGDGNALLGSFPDDVKSCYKNLLDKNREAFEELKTKHMNDITLNAKICIQEDIPSTPVKETIEAEVVLEKNSNEFIVETVEVVSEDVSQNTVKSSKEVIVIDENENEIELIETTSVSDEEINSENQEYYEQESPECNIEENDEDVISEDSFKSWESGQFFSD